MERTDEQIIAEIRRGDREAYRFLVERYQDRLLGVLLRLVADRQLAEEAAQEAFVKAYLALPRFRGESAFGTWLVQIGIHAARDLVRRRQRRQRREIPEPQETVVRLQPIAPGEDPLTRIVGDEDRERLLAALRLLPEDYREVLVLKHLEGWSFEEIAGRVQASVGSLKVRAHRARRQLRRSLAETAKPARAAAAGEES